MIKEIDYSMFWDIGKTLTYNSLINVIVGNRGGGKSYGAKKRGIDNFIKRREQFGYIRRYKEDLRDSMLQYFKDIEMKYPDFEFKTDSKHFYIRERPADPDTKWTEDDIAGYGGKAANCIRDGKMQTFEVGLKQPNAYGLYDMLGNVYEWCLDWYSEGTEYSDGSPVTDPKGAKANASKRRVCRGGSYGTAPTECRSSARTQASDENAWDDIYGFRFCCPAIAK